ncbi:hypothetical protein ACIRRX_25275 [Streptomyces bacillaris]|uniref:hypothetical protein n=1 Tax=unclassified Streptomyces TaxID=2593676 RepID=UPI00037E84BA|nr:MULTISPECIES: hypothetical protein [unclassified Streptomyces]MYT38648.1 hypothetical protein [Streptomyces sp. SID8356]
MPLIVEDDVEIDLSDLDLDIQAIATGGVSEPMRPAMFTFITCETTGTTGTSCGFTDGCNPMCC